MRDYFMKTERIGFSRWTEDDFELALGLWGDKEVTAYICATGEFTRQDIQRRLATEIQNSKDFNIQYWPIFELETGELIGCCGVRPDKSGPQSYELGFHLRKLYWGQGYAYEAAKKVIGYCFTALNAQTLFAGHHPQNSGSKKLLIKLGFTYIGDILYEPTGLYHLLYKLSAVVT